jgi:uncharacterized protein YkwD
MGPKGLSGHISSDGESTPFDRISRYGLGFGYQGENIAFAPFFTAEGIIMGLFVDDGVVSRGHRLNLMNENYRITGIAYCEHASDYKFMTEIIYAGGF